MYNIYDIVKVESIIVIKANILYLLVTLSLLNRGTQRQVLFITVHLMLIIISNRHDAIPLDNSIKIAQVNKHCHT